jgi:hypothetical protein
MKRVKLLDLIKEFELKVVDSMNGLKIRKFPYKSFNSWVEFDDIPDVKKALFEIQQEIIEKAEKSKLRSKAKFIGICRDEISGQYIRLKLFIDLDKLEDIECDLIELGENNSIHSAKIGLATDLVKNIITDPKDFEE